MADVIAPTVVAGHHTQHETGGSDAITALDGAILTSGTIADARLSAAIARLANPAFTGVPTAPTAVPGVNTAQIATTAFVMAAVPAAPVTLTDGATVTLDASLHATYYRLVAAGDRTIAAPTSPASGQKIVIQHVASGANRTLTLATGTTGSFRFSADISGLSATVSGKTDYIGAVYNATDSRWDVVGYTKGF